MKSSTVSPSAMMQIAPSALQGQHNMLHGNGGTGGGSDEVKPLPSALAQNHTTLHAMLSQSNHGNQKSPGTPTQSLHPSTIATSVHPGAYTTHNPDVFAGLAPAPYSTMTSFAGLTLPAPGVYTSNAAALGASTSPNPAQMATKSDPAALPGINPNTDVVTMVSMASISKTTSENLSNVAMLSGVSPHVVHNGGSPAVMYSSLSPSAPKAVPVMMDVSEGYLSGQDGDRATPSGGSPRQVKGDVVTLAPAQIPSGAQ